jgi:hypothetical protein
MTVGFVGPVLAAAALVAVTFLPFVPGGHDPLAVPLATIAWVAGHAGLVLVPVGLLWAWRNAPSRWLIDLTVAACGLVGLLLTVIAFASSSSVLLTVSTAAATLALVVRLARQLRATTVLAPRGVAAILTATPLAVVTAQSLLIGPATVHARETAIANCAPFIAAIEGYRDRHGVYPASLFSVWGDYKPAIVGIERYHYEPSGQAYNVIFREPSLHFGIRRFVVYNPRDRQRVTLHEQDRLRLDDAGLDADNAGHTFVEPLPQPHWKVFIFRS